MTIYLVCQEKYKNSKRVPHWYRKEITQRPAEGKANALRPGGSSRTGRGEAAVPGVPTAPAGLAVVRGSPATPADVS
jgi:hypothetical protein